MTKKFKISLLILLFVIFAIAGTISVFYSMGLQPVISENCELKNIFDCKLTFAKNGGIYIETKPKSVIIKIDGKEFKDESNLIQSGTLIKGISPKTHRLEISKTGFLNWQKKLKVVSEKVIEAMNVILVPDLIDPKIISFARLRGNQILDTENNRFLIRNTETNDIYLYDEKDLKSALNLNASFLNLKAGSSIKKIIFHPYDQNKFIVETNSGLNSFNSIKIKTEVITKSAPSAWDVKGSSVYFVEPISQVTTSKATTTSTEVTRSALKLSSFNLIVKNKTTVFNFPITIKSPFTEMKTSNSQDKFAFLGSNKTLYLLDNVKNSFTAISPNVEGFKFSPDNKKLAFWNTDKKEIEIYFIEDWQEGIRKKAGETITLNISDKNPDSKITNIYWHKDSFHIFAKTFNNTTEKDNLFFVEVDDRAPLNYYQILSNATDFNYSYKSEKLYLIADNQFYVWEF